MRVSRFRRQRLRLLLGGALAATALAGLPGEASPSPGWTPTLPLTQQSRQDLSAFADGNGYVFDVGSSAITLWHSSNYGVAWSPLTYLPAGISTFAHARFATPKVGYLSDLEALYTTSDGASTAAGWRKLAGPKVARGDYWEAYTLGVTGSTVAIAGDEMPPVHPGCNTPRHADVWTSHDGGRSWIDARLPANTYPGPIRFFNGRDGVLLAWDTHPDGQPCEELGDRSSVWVTHDGGRRFTRALRCAAKPGELCTAAAFLDARHLLVGRNDGTMTASSDGGRTFHEQPGLPTVLGPQPTKSDNDESFWIQGFSFNGQTTFATTKLAGAYVSDDGGRTWKRETTCDTAYSLGVGDIATFDSTRAIAGGPTCISTRLGGVGTGGRSDALAQPPAVTPPPLGSVDIVNATPHLRVTIAGGRLIVRRG